MLLLLVIKGHFADGLFQSHRDLTVVGDTRSSTLGIFVEAHFLVIYDTINIVPGPEWVQQRERSIKALYLPFPEEFHKKTKLLYRKLNIC